MTVLATRIIDVPRFVDPRLVHECELCGKVDDEESITFELWVCATLGGWVCRECHWCDMTCRDSLCDPSHI